MRAAVVFVLAALVACVSSHMSIFTPSCWGTEPNNINSNLLAHPLEDLDFNDWWWHGQDADGPINNAITTLPAGGTHDFEITGNKAFTSMGRGLCKADPNGTPRDPPNPWDNGWNGQCSANVHAPKRDEVAGCALAVAYKTSKAQTKPSDFVVFSVVHDCVARPLQVFDIPAMPACPGGLCMCAWFWIHNSVGGTDQMYMTPFQCNFSSPSNRKIGTPQPPVRCDGQPSCYLYPNWGNKTTVCRNPLQPMYWANNNGGNMQNPTNAQCAPVYNASYGFPDGAQNNIFVGMEALEGDFGDTILSTDDVNYISSDEGTRVVSPHRHSQLALAQDGNIIFSEVESQKVLWASKTSNLNGVAPYRLIMQNDGNLVLRDSKFNVFWQSNTAGRGTAPYKLKVRDFSSLKVIDANGYTIFSAL